MKNSRISLWPSIALVGLAVILASPASAAFFHTTSGSIDGSLCVGLDCAMTESFGFDTIRLKENNLRIHFDDTSSTASFPFNDWRISINDSSNGGSSHFSVEDATAGRFVFRLFAGAPSNSLIVDPQGDVGIGVSPAVVELHIKDGDTPTMRLEQDNSSGFTPQTWDVAGNEANFFVRDVTNGSLLPFKIKPDAPTNSLFVAADGDIGIGTDSPVAGTDMHVRNTSGAADITVQSTTGNAGFSLQDGSGAYWITNHVNSSGEYRINRSGDADVEASLGNNGDLTLAGEIITNNCPAGCGPADFVFEPDYDLMPLAELESFVQKERHLPNIPSAKEMEEGVQLTWMQMRLLEKVEELTLYTIDQQKLIEAQQGTISELSARLESLEGSSEQ